MADNAQDTVNVTVTLSCVLSIDVAAPRGTAPLDALLQVPLDAVLQLLPTQEADAPQVIRGIRLLSRKTTLGNAHETPHDVRVTCPQCGTSLRDDTFVDGFVRGQYEMGETQTEVLRCPACNARLRVSLGYAEKYKIRVVKLEERIPNNRSKDEL